MNDKCKLAHLAMLGCHEGQHTVHQLGIISSCISEAEDGGVVRSVDERQLKTMPELLLYAAASTTGSNRVQHCEELLSIGGFCDWTIIYNGGDGVIITYMETQIAQNINTNPHHVNLCSKIFHCHSASSQRHLSQALSILQSTLCVLLTWISIWYKNIQFWMRFLHYERCFFFHSVYFVLHGSCCVNHNGKCRALVKVQQTGEVLSPNGISQHSNVVLAGLGREHMAFNYLFPHNHQSTQNATK